MANQDSTAPKTFVIKLDSPATSAQVTFLIEAQELSSGGWPLLVSTYPSLDTTKKVTRPGTNTVYLRTHATLIFKANVTDQAKQAFFLQNNVTVLGVTKAGLFFLKFPDPGASISAFDAFIAALRASPEVKSVGGYVSEGYKDLIHGRYPSDSLKRQAWVTSGGGLQSGLWGMKAIRAPQAWGCETGMYGPSPTSAAVLEFIHDPNHPELLPSRTMLPWMPIDAELQRAGIKPSPASDRPQKFRHAAMVGGMLTATGDNDTATVGVAWRTGLQQYSYWSSGRRTLPPTGFYMLRGAMQQNSPRVLNISAGFGPDTLSLADRLHAIDLITDDLRFLYTDVPDLLIVVAAGNERNRMTPASYDSVPNVNLMIAALLRLRAEFPTRTIIVAGTRQGNNFWDTWALNPNVGSNSFTGATDIAAPADFILVQDTVAGGKVAVDLESGTSLAAPQVAGTAALLWSMDPSLTPAAVKDYILRGATEGRRDSSTGVLSAPLPVQGVPNGVTYYQLDVYGALSLLSRERPNTPICGYPVSAQGVFNGTYAVLYRNGPLAPATDSIRVPGAGGTLGYVGLAQGGRVLSAYTQVDSLNGMQQGVIYFNHLGQRLGNAPGVWGGRHYAEKHIVDHRQVGSPLGQEMTLRQANGTPITIIPRLQYPDGTTVGFVQPWEIEVSPDGRFVAFPAVNGTYVQQFAAPQATIRVGDRGFVQFSKDGTKLAVYSTDSIGINQTFKVYQVDNTASGGFTNPQTYSSTNFFLNPGVGYSGDDAVFYTYESNQLGNYFVTIRPANAMGTIVSSAQVVYRENRRIANVAAGDP